MNAPKWHPLALTTGLMLLLGFLLSFILGLQQHQISDPTITAVVENARSRIEIRSNLADLRATLSHDDSVRSSIAPWLNCLWTTHQSKTRACDQQHLSGDDSPPSVHWSYRRLSFKPLLTDRSATSLNHPIDEYYEKIGASQGSTTNGLAEPHVWLRRLWWETLGVPPTIKEMQAWGNLDINKVDDIVNFVLSDTKFGEHNATMWLDLVRYSDSNGYEEDEIREHAFAYRDFVIWAFNTDLPYDEFVRWQIAGDELAPGNPIAAAATGFLTAAPYNTFIPQESERWDELDNIISTLGQVFLGTTIGCARCHDHPSDPISTEDYYRMVAIFAATQRDTIYLNSDMGAAYLSVAGEALSHRDELQRMMIRSLQYDKILANDDFTEEDIARLRKPLDPNDKAQLDLLSRCGRCLIVDPSEYVDDWEPVDEDRQRYHVLLNALTSIEPHLPPEPPQALVIKGSQVTFVPVLYGGSLNNRGELVGPGVPDYLTVAHQYGTKLNWEHWDQEFCEDESPRPRLALANWMTNTNDGAGSLLARVIVNRIWQRYFGHGLVDSLSDFGAEAPPPEHLELLERLAQELVHQNWSLKSIHRLILTSSLYRQPRLTGSSAPRFIHSNPPNRIPRLTGEMFYDSLFVLAGNLNPEMYGPAYQPEIPLAAIHFRDEEAPDKTWPTQVFDRPAVWRRAIYAMRRRSCPIPLLQLLDATDRTQSVEARQVTTVPTQMLLLMNDPMIQRQCQRMAVAALAHAEQTNSQALVDSSYRLVLGRLPDSFEQRIGVEILSDCSLAELIHLLVMSHEFWYIR